MGWLWQLQGEEWQQQQQQQWVRMALERSKALHSVGIRKEFCEQP